MKRNLGLTPNQNKLIACLLTERTIDLACKKAGVNVVTYWRWMKQSEFEAEYRAAMHGIIVETVSQLQRLTRKAAETLERNLDCQNPNAEIRASQIIIEQALKGAELLDLADKVENIKSFLRIMNDK